MSLLSLVKIAIAILCASLSTLALADTSPSSDKTIVNNKNANEAYNQLSKQDFLNIRMSKDFIVFMKYKETICSSVMDVNNKKINLISFDYANRKNTIEFVEGLKKSRDLLLSIIMEDEEAQESILPKNARAQSKPMFEVSMFVDEYLDEFDNCSKKFDVNSKKFFDYYKKALTKADNVSSVFVSKKIKNLK